MPPPPDDDQPLLEEKPADDLWRFRPYLLMLARNINSLWRPAIGHRES